MTWRQVHGLRVEVDPARLTAGADVGGSMGGARSVPTGTMRRLWRRIDRRCLDFVGWLDETTVADALRQFLAWLRRPRRKKAGTLAPVLVTADGVVVDRIERVPLRSSKADAKRQALAWARQHFKDPAMTWGQARKAIRRFEREEREFQRERMLSAHRVRNE